jgi:hypothetical protein
MQHNTRSIPTLLLGFPAPNLLVGGGPLGGGIWIRRPPKPSVWSELTQTHTHRHTRRHARTYSERVEREGSRGTKSKHGRNEVDESTTGRLRSAAWLSPEPATGSNAQPPPRGLQSPLPPNPPPTTPWRLPEQGLHAGGAAAQTDGRRGRLAPRDRGPTRPPVGGTGLRQGPGLLIAAVFRVAAVSGCAVIGHGEAGRPELAGEKSRLRRHTHAAASHLN